MIRLKYERLNRGWTQQDVAYKANLHVADISRIETGRMKPYPKHYHNLVRLFDISGDELFSEFTYDKDFNREGGNKNAR